MVDIRKMFKDSARMITDIAEKPLAIDPGMGKWLDYCAAVAPECKALWPRLRKLDFNADANDLESWLTRLFAREPPPNEINGLWFGLHNPVLDDGKPSCQMYVGGSTAYDPDSTSNEWVCQLSYVPKGRYATSKVLNELYRSVEPVTKNNVNSLGEAFLCHGYLALVVSHWCKGPMRTLLRGDASIRAVVIGHDSGDFYRMAILSAR